MKIDKGNKTLNLNQLREFDIILTHTPFNIKEPVTYLSALIRFFQRDYYNHAKLVLLVNDYLLTYAKQHNIDTHNAQLGDMCIIEALAEGVELDFDIKNNLINEQLIIQRSKLIQNLITFQEAKEYRERAYFTIGKKYDYKSCLLFQLVRQVAERLDKPIESILGNVNVDVWIGEKNRKATKTFYCSEVCAYVHYPMFPDFFKISPDDLHWERQLVTVLEGKITQIL